MFDLLRANFTNLVNLGQFKGHNSGVSWTIWLVI